jgi:hypothetical protein
MRTGRAAASVVLAGLLTVALAACGPPQQRGLTAEQCERFTDARWSLDIYTADDWAAFFDGKGVRVLSGVQRAVGEFIDGAEELRTAETEQAVEAVVQAGYGYTNLAAEYLDDPPVAGDAADLSEQARVRDALDAALSDCTEQR